MTYLERLSPWCIIKLLPNMQRLTVARCRRRNDAEEHMVRFDVTRITVISPYITLPTNPNGKVELSV